MLRGRPENFKHGKVDRGSTTVSLKELNRWRRTEREQGAPRELLLERKPKTRGECCEGERPCPWVSCKYNLFLDVEPSGSIKFNFRGSEPDELADSCALDIADRGGAILAKVGEVMNVTRERIRQIEATALRKLKRADAELAPFEDTGPRLTEPDSPEGTRH